MDQQNFLKQYNNNLLNGLGARLVSAGFVFWVLMTLFIPARLVPEQYSTVGLAFLILSFVGAIGVILVALAVREIEKRRVREC
ncbi:hypothetical protein KU6B_47160 [Mameliella alba]|uniref:hypothetical protein n=1 Tax=Mameliella alba TaxID=561184 RepID=UPI0013E4D346|nr:hypothetical protein [Mameliella alba]BBU58451.1 hypothetical protein KU6B_47160 [Mameliella alba]